MKIAAAFVRHVAPKGWQCRGGEVYAVPVGFCSFALSRISIVSGLGHIFVFKVFLSFRFRALAVTRYSRRALPRDVKDSLNVSTFFVFPEGFLTLACLLVKLILLKRKRTY